MRIERDQWTTTIVLALMLAVFGGVVWLPAQLQANRLTEQIAAAHLERGEGEQALAALPDLRDQVDQLRERLDGSSGHIPTTPELASLTRELNAALQRRGAADVHARHGESFRGASYNIIPITLQFRSSFIDTYLFIEHVESMDRLIRIDRVDLVGDSRSPDELLFVTIELSAFFVPATQTGEGASQ